MPNDILLKVKNLKTRFHSHNGFENVVNGVSFDVKAGKILGIVGESGCGKSVTSLSIIGLIDYPGEIVSGEVLLNGKNLLDFSKKQLRQVRGKEISMIFQNSMTSLNPVLTIGTQIVETIRTHELISKEKAKERTIDILKKVGLSSAQSIVKKYPFQLSGGMCQRVMIAMALCLNPKVLIADEPTTALDVTVQAQILSQLKRLKNEFNSGIILITHDLGVIAQMADEVMVMYAGSIVEYGEVFEIFNKPSHPYTKALLNSIPQLGKKKRLEPICGQSSSSLNSSNQCSFLNRCSKVGKKCMKESPHLKDVSHGHKVACFYADNYKKCEGDII